MNMQLKPPGNPVNVDKPPPGNPVNVDKPPQRRAEGYVSTYSNYVEIGFSRWDIRLLFFEYTEDEEGEIICEKKARVVMSPQHAGAVAQVLNDTLEQWAKEHAP